ncbi:Alpha/Beta hydrolase protein [Bombardia bombarda]|uniref:Alpha/Beta hydrolase protein n=1 Tax=Bombardia bombarda TaxID=252184 RepID=A0AA40C9P2_9PEZI|nr:Alpha/Beta hydrolase protein [Bombardia bombarda]
MTSIASPPANCCTTGFKHEGTPTGTSITIAGKWTGYLATPPASAPSRPGTGLLYLPDVIGIWQNSQLMADQYAAAGYTTLIVDLFNGDALSLNRPDGFDFMAWLTKGSDGNNPHTALQVDPIVSAAIKTLKEEYGVTKLGALGYCFGAKYVFRHFKEGIDVGFVAHPSFVEEDELRSLAGPVAEEILKETGMPYQIGLYSGVEHGFSVRCDMSKKVERFAKEQAFYQAVTWFDNWL